MKLGWEDGVQKNLDSEAESLSKSKLANVAAEHGMGEEELAADLNEAQPTDGDPNPPPAPGSSSSSTSSSGRPAEPNPDGTPDGNGPGPADLAVVVDMARAAYVKTLLQQFPGTPARSNVTIREATPDPGRRVPPTTRCQAAQGAGNHPPRGTPGAPPTT